MTRAHVRLLGPCFKTGRMGCRLNRHRPYALTPEDPDPDRPQSESTAKQSSPVERAEEARLRRRGGEFLSLPAGQRDRRAITPTSEDAGHLLEALLTASKPVAALSPRKVHPPTAAAPGGRSERIRLPRPQPNGKVEFRGSTLRSHPFTSKRFHVLLNSLFKVLFNFPSRYLSAIGLVSVFSLRWSLPPTLGCILKQPDSKEAPSKDQGRRRGLTPALGKAPIRGTRTTEVLARLLLNTTVPVTRQGGGFGAGLFPLHSPLLRESSLVSFPPLSDMLKFRG